MRPEQGEYMAEKSIVRVGVGCWIFNPAGLVLFGQRLSHHGNGTWAPPGGHLEFGETPECTAARELFEETGIKIPTKDFRIIGFTNDIFPDKHYITIHVRADNIDATPKLMEPNKCATWQWFSLDKLPRPLFLAARNLLNTNVL